MFEARLEIVAKDKKNAKEEKKAENIPYPTILPEKALDVIHQENAIVKVFTSTPGNESAWLFLLEQLADSFHIRPSRSNRVGQWQPLQGPNKSLRFPGRIKKPKKTPLIKKTASTLLPADGQIQLCGYEVGILFDLKILAEQYKQQNKNLEKYVFTVNAGTTGAFKRDLLNKSVCSIDVIRQQNRLARKSNKILSHNELLMCFSLEALSGLFTTKDDLNSRLNLLYHQRSAEERLAANGFLHFHLPLLIIQPYAPAKVYSLDQQMNDFSMGMTQNNPIALKIQKKGECNTDYQIKNLLLQDDDMAVTKHISLLWQKCSLQMQHEILLFYTLKNKYSLVETSLKKIKINDCDILLIKDNKAIIEASLRQADAKIIKLFIALLSEQFAKNWDLISNIVFYESVQPSFLQKFYPSFIFTRRSLFLDRMLLENLFSKAISNNHEQAIRDLLKLVNPTIDHLIIAFNNFNVKNILLLLSQNKKLLAEFLLALPNLNLTSQHLQCMVKIFIQLNKNDWINHPNCKLIVFNAAKNNEYDIVHFFVNQGMTIQLSSDQIIEIYTQFAPSVLSLILEIDPQILEYENSLVAMAKSNHWSHVETYLQKRTPSDLILQELASLVNLSHYFSPEAVRVAVQLANFGIALPIFNPTTQAQWTFIVNFIQLMGKEYFALHQLQQLLRLAIEAEQNHAIKVLSKYIPITNAHLRFAFIAKHPTTVKTILKCDKELYNDDVLLEAASSKSWATIFAYLQLRRPEAKTYLLLWEMAFAQLIDESSEVNNDYAYQTFLLIAESYPQFITPEILKTTPKKNELAEENNKRYLLLNQFLEAKQLGGIQRFNESFCEKVFNFAVLNMQLERVKILINEQKSSEYLKKYALNIINKSIDPMHIIQIMNNVLEIARQLGIYYGKSKSTLSGCYWRGDIISRKWIYIIREAKKRILFLAETLPFFNHANEHIIVDFLSSPTGITTSFFNREAESGNKYKNLKERWNKNTKINNHPSPSDIF